MQQFWTEKEEYGNFCFAPKGYDTERVMLAAEGYNQQEELISQVKSFYSQNYTQQKIAEELGIAQSKSL